MQPLPLLIDIVEVSRLTGVPIKTLRDWRTHHRGPRSARIGRRVMYRRDDVVAWVDSHFDACQTCGGKDSNIRPGQRCAGCGQQGPAASHASVTRDADVTSHEGGV